MRARQPAPNSRLVAGDGLMQVKQRARVRRQYRLHVRSRRKTCVYCVAHFEHLLRQRAGTEMPKVYLAELMATRAQLAEAARRTGKCAALTA